MWLYLAHKGIEPVHSEMLQKKYLKTVTYSVHVEITGDLCTFYLGGEGAGGFNAESLCRDSWRIKT